MTALPAVIDVGIEAIHGIDDAITVGMGKNRNEDKICSFVSQINVMQSRSVRPPDLREAPKRRAS